MNPYTPWPGASPPFLAGRQGDTKFVEGAFGQAKNGKIGMHPIFVGDPGVGKTTMLNYAVNLAKTEGWMVLSVEARAGYSVVNDLVDQVRSGLESISQDGKTESRIKALLSRIQSIQVSVLGSGAGVGLGRAPQSSLLPVSQVFREIGDLARERETKVVFSIDEMDQLSTDEMQLVLGAMHVANQTQSPLIVVGAGGNGLRAAMKLAKNYGDRFMLTKLQPLNYEEMEAAIARPAEALGVTVAPDAMQLMTEAAKGIPADLQAIAFHAWNFATDKKIDLQAAMDAHAEVALDSQQLDSLDVNEYSGVS